MGVMTSGENHPWVEKAPDILCLQLFIEIFRLRIKGKSNARSKYKQCQAKMMGLFQKQSKYAYT